MSQTGTYSGGGGGGGGIITINGDVSSVTGNIVTFTGGSNGGVFTGNGTTTMTLSFNYLALPNSDGSGNGSIRIGGVPFARAFGANNTFVGKNSGNLTLSGQGNSGYGEDSLGDLTSGNFNTAAGYLSGASLTSGGGNISIGNGTMFSALSAGNNTAVGSGGNMSNLIDGIGNIALGFGAGGGLSGNESYNILIGYNQVGTAAQSNTLRIGNSAGVGGLTSAFIGGIYGVTPLLGSPQSVIIDSNGQLGSTSTVQLMPWIVEPGFTVSMVANTGYIADAIGAPLVAALPTSINTGEIVRIAGVGSGGWSISQMAGQQIHFGNQSTTLGAAGSISSTNEHDCIELLCISDDTTFIVLGAVGNLMVV